MINNAVIRYLYSMDKVSSHWFMEDCTTLHPIHRTFDLLAEYFDSKIIGLDSEKKAVNGMD